MVLEQYGSQSSQERLDRTFAALADPTRRALLARLSRGDASVAELAAPFAVSPRAVSKHLSVLERAGLIERRRDAQRRPSTLRVAPLAEADAWMRKFRERWSERFAAIDELLAADESTRDDAT
jgi:DNA-binding transcriptional ArsR family regulator